LNLLETIMGERRADVREARQRCPPAELAAMAAGRRHHSLVERLRSGPGPRIIAEMKKASPSAGLICADYDPVSIGRSYEAAGAAGISVLTEPRRFLGRLEHLRDVRAAVRLPVLRKDFVCDPYQIVESAAWGADAVLLIVAALSGEELRRLYEEALAWGLDVLVESHTAAELEAALALERAILGINSRDLRTLRTDLAVARSLAARVPADRLSVAESGIRGRADVLDLASLGYDGFLVGAALLSAGDPGKGLREMVGF
jgi:indole-3-glycerol phosphate synthase